MDRITRPVPTASELTSAILILSHTVQSLRVKHSIISSAAIYLHATPYKLPRLLPSSITILIHPTPKFSSPTLTRALADRKQFPDFLIVRKNGIDYPKVIIKRPRTDMRGHLYVDFTVVDHWLFPEKSSEYDFRLRGNQTVPLMVEGEQVFVMSPEWLLRQKIRVWNERLIEKERRRDEIEIRTLVDVFGVEGIAKIVFRKKRDVVDLRRVVRGMDRDDPGVLGSVIDCPKVFGPWWRLTWVRAAAALGLALVVTKILDYLSGGHHAHNE